MAYFLKKTKNKKGIYLQIYESHRDPVRKETVHKSIKPLGYVDDLIAKGIEDPITYYKDEIQQMNLKRKAEKFQKKQKQISEETPARYLGYFPLKRVNDALGTKSDIDMLQKETGFHFDLYDMMASLTYARAVKPCSKRKTYLEVLPRLYESTNYSLDQIYDGIAFMGSEYQKIIEIYNHHIAQAYPRKTDRTYFDCTNFYFEIDAENGFCMKGPSKENRHEPIVGMGLLLDADRIPLGMQIYPGNKSEKPVMREVIDDLKTRASVSGRTIITADKGLNCAENIANAIAEGDGYLFSKSVKTLPAIEKEWVLLDQDYQDVVDSNGKILYRYKSCVDEFEYKLVVDGNKVRPLKVKEKRVVTFNPDLARKKNYEIDREVEKARLKCLSQAKKDEFGDCGKYVTFTSTDKDGNKTGGKVKTTINEDKINEDRLLAGYNLLVTSEVDMSERQIYEAYHNLWRIEESFRVMKSDLDARPVYLQKPESITGHFLICYLAVLLLRLYQFNTLDGEYGSEDIMNFVRDFKVVKAERYWINVTRSTPFIREMAERCSLPVTNYYLRDSDVQEMLSYPVSIQKHADSSDKASQSISAERNSLEKKPRKSSSRKVKTSASNNQDSSAETKHSDHDKKGQQNNASSSGKGSGKRKPNINTPK